MAATFDPSKPFEVIAPAFDPNQPFEPVESNATWDAVKQAGAGLVKGVENIATGPAHIANLAGQGADWLLKKAGYEADPQAAQNQQALRALATSNSGGGIEQYLPQPQTPEGKFTRSATEMVPQALALKGGLANNAVMGATAGLAGEGAEQLAENYAPNLEPYARAAGTLVGGYAGGKTAQALAARAAKVGAPATDAAEKVAALKAASNPIYEELKTAGNSVTLKEGAGAQIVKDISAELHPQALRPENAERTYKTLKDLNKATDLNDVSIVRDNLRKTVNGIADDRLVVVSGQDKKAAGQAMKALDTQMDSLSPGWTARMAEADSNWAAARRIETVQKQADRGVKGRLGSFDSSESRAKGYTKDEIAAIKRAHTGGPVGAALDTVGALNPFRGGLEAKVQAGMTLPAALMTGGYSLLGQAAAVPIGMAADAGAKALRRRALNNAYSKLAERSALGKNGNFVFTQPPGQLTNSLLLGGMAASHDEGSPQTPEQVDAALRRILGF
jgi:hypothetical protein